MGCDIHMHVEYKWNGEWLCGDYFRLRKNSTVDRPEYMYADIYGNRNYALFAMLANVRNYGDTEYIDEPRGLPEDCTDFVKEDYEWWIGDAHSCSYFTLKELIDFHKRNVPLRRSGLLSPEQLDDLDNRGITPDHWCQGTNRPGYERRYWNEKNEVLVPLIEKLKDRANELGIIYSFYWDRYDEIFNTKGYYLADDIRIVFWFDN